MGMSRVKIAVCLSGCHRISAILMTMQLLLPQNAFPQRQTDGVPGLVVTPSSTVLLLGETFPVWVADETGRPLANVQWSISRPIADLQVRKGSVVLQAREAGRALLTATANHQSATAAVAVLDGEKLPPASVRWSL